MGIGCAIPGVSGGTIAIMLGVYDRHLDDMNNLRSKKFFTALLALLPLLVGVIVGVIPAVILFNLTFKGFLFGTVSLFDGFVIGGIPSILDVTKQEKIKKTYIIILIIAFVVALGLGILSALVGDKLNLLSHFNMNEDGGWIDGGHVDWWIYILMIPIGVIASAALIVPGISGSMILLVTGFYSPLLKTVDWWKLIFKGQGNGEMAGSLIGVYLCFLLGILIGFFTIVKLMKFLFDKYKIAAYYGILGFVFGSIGSLYFNNDIFTYYKGWANGTSYMLSMPLEIVLGAVLLAVGIILSYLLVRYQRKSEKKELAN